MPVEAEVVWKQLVAEGKFKVTEMGVILKQKTKKEVRKLPLKNPKNNSVGFKYGKKSYTLRKPRAIWLAFNDHPPPGFNVVTKDGSFDWRLDNLEIINESTKQSRTIAKHGYVQISQKKRETYRLNNLNKSVSGKAKLNGMVVIELRKQAKITGKIKTQEWCRLYNIQKKALFDALTGVTYAWLNNSSKPVKIKV